MRHAQTTSFIDLTTRTCDLSHVIGQRQVELMANQRPGNNSAFLDRGKQANLACKNDNDQAYSYLRDLRLSAIMGAHLGTPLKPSNITSTMVPRVLRGALYWVPIMPRHAS